MNFPEGKYVFYSNKSKVNSDIKDNDMKQNATDVVVFCVLFVLFCFVLPTKTGLPRLLSNSWALFLWVNSNWEELIFLALLFNTLVCINVLISPWRKAQRKFTKYISFLSSLNGVGNKLDYKSYFIVAILS